VNLLFSVLFGLALGFSLTVPPGPMNGLIAARASRHLRDGIITGAGAMSADLVLGALVFLVRSAVDLAALLRYLDAVGAAVLTAFGILTLRHRHDDPASSVPPGRVYLHALGLGLGNPFQIVWWVTAGLAFAYLGGLPLLAGLFGAVAIWILAFPWAIHAGVRRYPKVRDGIVLGSAVIMFGFAAYFLLLAA
jgi:threonine/homoserine/homoserine lactone efflux protein